ncbi:MAG: radical SAM protein, partial [Myxococcota bacterium]
MKILGFQWHITDRCNLRCRHCYQDTFSNEREKDITTLKSYADKIFGYKKGYKIAVNITGGEPLLYPNLIELLTHIDRYENCSEINIITNGTFINERLIEQLDQIRHLKYIKVSIESPDKSTNDGIRGDGNLDRVKENLNAFKRLNRDILIMMTLGSYNFRDVSKMVEFVVRFELSGIIFERFVPLGSGRAISTDFLKRYELRSVIEEILKISKLQLLPEDLIQYRAFWLIRSRRRFYLKGALCNLGPDSFALMPDGSIYPCRRYNKKVADLNVSDLPSIRKILSNYEISEFKKRINSRACGSC